MITSRVNMMSGVRAGCAVAGLLFVLVGAIGWTENRRQLAETKHQECLLDEVKAQESAVWRAPATAPFGLGAVKALGRAIDLRRRAVLERYNIHVSRAQSVTSLWTWLITLALAMGILGVYILIIRVDRGLQRAASGFSAEVKRMGAASLQGSSAGQSLA
jgi:hypothetical protein